MKIEEIYESIKNSLGELQYEYESLIGSGDDKDKLREEWLKERIKYLKKNPKKIKSIGVLKVEDMIKKQGRLRVEGWKKVKENIDKKIIIYNNS